MFAATSGFENETFDVSLSATKNIKRFFSLQFETEIEWTKLWRVALSDAIGQNLTLSLFRTKKIPSLTHSKNISPGMRLTWALWGPGFTPSHSSFSSSLSLRSPAQAKSRAFGRQSSDDILLTASRRSEK